MTKFFLRSEIEDLAKSLDDLLNDRLNAPTEFNCIEPDFNFILNRRRICGLILRSYMSDRAVKSLILIWSGKSRSWMKD